MLRRLYLEYVKRYFTDNLKAYPLRQSSTKQLGDLRYSVSFDELTNLTEPTTLKTYCLKISQGQTSGVLYETRELQIKESEIELEKFAETISFS